MADAIQTGDVVLLLGPDGERHIVKATAETKRVEGLGVIRLVDLAGKPWGGTLALGPQSFRLVRPTLTDHLRLLERKAQIVLAKDASRIVLETGVHAGSRVVEAGVGSGSLTLVLAHAVAPTGRVYAYDLRPDHLDVGRRNLERADLAGVVEFAQGDVARDVRQEDVDAFVLDVPEPQAGVAAAWSALRSGGVFAAYSPIVAQVEGVVKELRARGFVDVRPLETLERGWVVHERGSRPETNMLAHTGFLTFARHP